MKMQVDFYCHLSIKTILRGVFFNSFSLSVIESVVLLKVAWECGGEAMVLAMIPGTKTCLFKHLYFSEHCSQTTEIKVHEFNRN